MRNIVNICVLAFFLLFESCGLIAQDHLLEDFDQGKLSDRWAAKGPISLERKAVANAEANPDGPAGNALVINASGRAVLISKPNAFDFQTMPRSEEIALWVWSPRKSLDELPVTVFDLLFMESDNRAAFWRKVEIFHAGWQQVRLPLAWFRWETGRVPDWRNVTTFAIRTRGQTDLKVDQIELKDTIPDVGPEATVEQLKDLAFPERDNVQISQTPGFVVLSDAVDLEMAKLQDHLQKVQQYVRAELRLTQKPIGQVKLLVFRDQESYRRFAMKFAKQLGAVTSPPTSDGFHLQGLALSSWDPKQGTVRPVFTHEFVHSLLSHEALIDSSHSDWFQEGLASYFQLKFHPQENVAQMVRRGVVDPSSRSPWETLVNGQSIALNRYWQAATLCDFLLHHPQYSPKWPELVERFQQSGSTDLNPWLKEVYGKDWKTLETEWKEFCTEKYQN